MLGFNQKTIFSVKFKVKLDYYGFSGKQTFIIKLVKNVKKIIVSVMELMLQLLQTVIVIHGHPE